MTAIKLLNLFALSTLAILFCSFGPTETLAVSVQPGHLARQIPNHHNIAKKKRATKRCKPKPSSSLPVSSTPAPKPTSKPADPPKSDPPKSEPSKDVTPPKTNTPTGPGKLAIAWAMGNDKRISFLAASKRVKMFHLWDAEIPQGVKDTGIPVSIMLWGTSQDKIERFRKFAKPGYATHAYGQNEVNQYDQGETSVSRAVEVWYQELRPLANQGYTLGSPVTTSAPNGFDWVKDFFNQCGDDCNVGEVPIHWYDVEFEDFKTYVNKWATGFKKPIRVTEFACQNFNGGGQPSMDHIWDFTDKAIKYLEGDDRVLSYAPFGFMDDMNNVAYTNRLFAPGTLSDLGWKYVNGS